MLPDPVEVSDNKSHSYLGLLLELAKERFVGDAIVQFAAAQYRWFALHVVSKLC